MSAKRRSINPKAFTGEGMLRSLVCTLALALALALFMGGVAATPAAAADVVVNSVSGSETISRSLLRAVFGMRVRAWPDGTPVRVFVLEDHDPAHVDFCKTVLRIYPYQLRQNWDRLVYSGTGQPPIAVATEQELRRQVAVTPGAIGYVNKLDSSVQGEKLKVLNVHE